MKKALYISICILLMLPVLLYVGIMITNNAIAHNIENELRATPLPQDTQLVDSISIAGKITGNGNGMQYFGALLVTSELSADELAAHYGAEVQKQESAVVFEGRHETFSDFDAEANNYIVYTWGSHGHDLDSFVDLLLNFDLRGH